MENQREVWDSAASEWNEYRKEEQPIVAEFLKGKRGKLLDLGCGNGRNFIYSPLIKWYCIDFSEKMLKHASINAGAKNIEAEFFQSEAHDLNFEDNFFDQIICHAVLHCIKGNERERAIKEIFRVLRSGGQALISVWSKNSKILKNKNKECYVGWHSTESEKRLRYTYIYDFDELKDLLIKTGFKVILENENNNLEFIVEKP
jgi:ubiquinone/menaquinone biosynthesis C-methylase UbiE